MDTIFQNLYNVITRQQQLINALASKLELLEIGTGGGSGNATISDYESNKLYARNTLVVDPETEVLYRVLSEYTSITVADDCENGKLKAVGFESQFITFNHNPTQAELNPIPDDTLVAIYETSANQYIPDKNHD